MRFRLVVACLTVAACADQHTSPSTSANAPVAATRAALDSSPTLASLGQANVAFRAWVASYQSASPLTRPGMVEQGTGLATTRRALMRELLLRDPEHAIELAFSPPERGALPGIIRERVERWHDGIATLHVIASTVTDPSALSPVDRFVTFDDAESSFLKAGVFGRRLNQQTQRNLKLHGVELDGVIGLTGSPFRKLWPGEHIDLPSEAPSLCPTSKNKVDSDLIFHAGDTVAAFCLSMHADKAEHRLVEQEQAAGIPATAWSTGPKTVLMIRVDFSDRAGDPISDSSATNLIDTQTNNFYKAASYDQTSMALTLTPTYRMAKTAAAYNAADDFLGLMTDAHAAAKAAGFDLNAYTHEIIASSNIFTTGWSGRGYVGSKGVWVNGDYTLRVVGHELGHNYGVYHANFLNAGLSIISAQGANVEYGNPFDMMSAGGNSSTHFNVWFKRVFDWVPSSEVQLVSASGTYRIYALEAPISTGLHGLKVPRTGDSKQRDYWLEFRQAFTSNPSAMSGTIINFGYPYSGAQGSHLLDMTPEGNTSDSALVIGRTFSDPLAGVYLTPVGKGGTTPESLDVVVNVGTFPGNRAPTASIAYAPSAVSNGAQVTFTVTASDPDGDTLAYAWDFDDGQLSVTNAAAVMRTMGSDRVQNVRCTVSDMKGALVTVGVSVTVGTPTSFTLEGTVTEGGVGLEGVRIDDGTRVTRSRSDGTWQLTQVPAGAFTISASKSEYGFARGFSAPLTVAASMTGLDFTATASGGYTVSGTVMANGAGMAGVTVSNGSLTATTGSDGKYSLSPVPNGRKTMTATKLGWLFTPSTGNPVEVLGGNVTTDFYAQGSYLSGSIPSAGVATAPVVTNGVQTTTCYSNGASSWAYNLGAVPNGQWNLSATSPGVSLKPNGFTNPITISGAARNNLNFSLDATTAYRISGQVTTGGTPYPGVVVSDGTRSSTTDTLGFYLLIGVPSGTYTLTPSHAGQTFVPATKSVMVAGADLTGQDFTTTDVNAAPTVAVAAASSANPALGTSVTLSVLGADDQGEAALTYTWVEQGSATGSTFSANGTNAAKTTTVTFAQAFTHGFEVIIADAGGLSVRSSVTLNVTQAPVKMTISPPSANVTTGAKLQFSSILVDQFGKPIYSSPFVYSVPVAAGTVSTNGLFTAASTPGGPYALTTTAAGKSASASVLVTPVGAPSLVQSANASPSPVTGVSTSLSVIASDDKGEASLVYAWAAPGAPAAVNFSASGTNAAKTSVATFSQAGDYDLVVTITDGDANYITSLVHVVVQATPTHVAVEPQAAMVLVGGTLTLTATVSDQFNHAIAPPPAVVFTVSGGGTITPAGVFTAGATVGGPFTVTATALSVSGTSSVSVSMTPDTMAPVVALTAPLANTRLESTAALSATASDNVGVAKVEFFVDALKVGEATADPYTVMVDFASIANGAHVLTAKATDAAGNSATSDGVPVNVGPLPMDQSPPVVSITAPAGGETGLVVAVAVNASDDVAVVSVKLELDGAVVRDLTTAPWVASLDVVAGAHSLVAIAADAAGKSTRSAAVAFTAREGVVVQPDGGVAGRTEPARVIGGCGCGETSGAPLAVGLLLLGLALRRRSPRSG